MFGIKYFINAKPSRKILYYCAYLFVFLFLILFADTLTERVFAQSDATRITANHKLVSARQLLIEGTDCLHNNQNQQAKLKLEDACIAAPDLPQAHHQLGIALAKLGENDAAINEFSTAIKLDPNSAASWLNLAAVYQTSGNIEQAKATYQEFIDRFPQDKDVTKIRALVNNLSASQSAFSKPNINDISSSNSTHSINKIESENGPNSKNNADNDYYADISRRGIWIWSKDRMPLKVFIEKAKTNNGASVQYISILKGAFKDWAASSNGLLSFTFIDSVNQADIVCNWSRDVSKFKNSSEAANAKVYAKNEMLDKGEIEILTISPADLKSITENQMRMTALHEIGHIIGLTGHSSNPNDVMYISTSLKDAWIKLSNRDINTVERLYSVRRP